jgi:formyltetrahydrofolate-dependent phosphoribosylglycinamide formyltransferase
MNRVSIVPSMPKFSAKEPSVLRLAVLISGGGTTLINLARQIQQSRLSAEIVDVIASRACPGIERSAAMGLNPVLLSRRDFPTIDTFSERIFERCRQKRVGLVVLGGFLSQIVIPADFEQRVMNIHPALIPAFCGKGMFGHRVHEAVLARGCKVSGCTVHFCDNDYDHGPIILQRAVPVLDDDTADSLAERVFVQECEALPEAIRLYAESRLVVEGDRVRILPESAAGDRPTQ